MTSLLKQFGYNVSLARHQAGLTQEGLAAISGVHSTEISRIENGRRNMQLESVARLAKALDVSLAQLLGGPGGLDYPVEREEREEPAAADADDS